MIDLQSDFDNTSPEMANIAPEFVLSETREENRQKTRFDPLHPEFIRPDEDDEVDEFEQDIGLSRKRKTVRTDVSYQLLGCCVVDLIQGYDTDSSQERKSKKSKTGKKSTSKDESDDDDDMFSDAEGNVQNDGDTNAAKGGDEEDEYGKLKRKQVKFVDYTEFEGQEISDEAQDPDDEEESIPSTPGDSDKEEIDEDVGLAGLKKHAPRIEKFNLKQEQSEGAFTEDGTYVRKAADPRAHQDTWMQGLTKGAIRRAKEGAKKQRERELELEKREKQEASVPHTERLRQLIRYLRPSETPLEALARLNQGKKKKWKPTQKWKKSQMEVDEENRASEEDAKIKQEIERLTAQADMLLNYGIHDIYSIRKERLIMMYQEDTGERYKEEPAPGSEDVKWEYRWAGTDDIHSGFSSEDMKNWKTAGFFGEGVLCRPVGSSGDWKSSTDITF